MEIKYNHIITSESALRKIANTDFGSAKKNIEIGKFMQKLNAELEIYYQLYNKLVEDYGSKISEKTFQVDSKSKKYPEFSKRVEELQNTSLSLKCPEITPLETEKINLLPAEYIHIQWWFNVL